MKGELERLGREIDVKTANRMCLDKRKFASRNAARDFIKSRKELYEPQQSYKCSLCFGFHLTTSPKTDNSMIRKRKWKKDDAKPNLPQVRAKPRGVD